MNLSRVQITQDKVMELVHTP